MRKNLKTVTLFTLGGYLLLCLAFTACGQKNVLHLHVADFGAVPDDGIDDAPAVRKALKFAKEAGAVGLKFDAGRYDLMTIEDGDTLRKIGFEEKYPRTPMPNLNVTEGLFFIGLQEFTNFSFEGAVDEKGDPATWLVRANPVKNHYFSPPLLYITDCSNLTVKNIGLDNDPYFYSAGVIVEINREAKTPYVVVDVFPGHPRVPNMGSFMLGCYDIEKSKLLAGRLSFNTIGAWQPIEGGSGRLMKLESSEWFKPDPYFRYVKEQGLLGEPLDKHLPVLTVGQVLYWHQSYNNSKQVTAIGCTNLAYINVHTRNASGFGFDTRLSKNLLFKKIVAAPGPGRIMTGQRDAFKINNCTGTVEIDSCHFEGFNDDAQNVHGNWYITSKVSDDRLTAFFYKPLRLLPVGSEIGFFDPSEVSYTNRTIKACSLDTMQKLLAVTLDSPLPAFVDSATEASPKVLLPTSYRISNSVFRNIEGSGIILKTPNAIIENCRFENIMNMGVQLGDERAWESGIPHDVIIRNNIFDNCGGFINRKENPPVAGWFFGDPAAISLSVDKLDVPGAIHNVQITGNIFRNIPLDAIYLRDAANIYISGNRFESVTGQKIMVDPKTTFQIIIENNQ